MTLAQVIEGISAATISAMIQENPAQCGQLREAVGQVRTQAAGHSELAGLVAFLDAVRSLLEMGQADEVELQAPFDEVWQRILEGIEGGSHG